MINRQPLSIVMITNNYWPYRAGVVKSIDVFTEYLRALGHKVSIIALDFAGEYSDAQGVYRLVCPLKFSYRGSPMAVPLRAQAQIAKIFAQTKPDIVHVHHPFLLGWSGLRGARASKVPVVFTHHTLYEDYSGYVPGPQRLVKEVIKRRVQSFCNQVDGIIAPSSHVKELIRLRGCAAPLKVIASPVARDFCERLPVLRSADGPIKLLTVSRFAKEKNIAFILKAFSLLDPAHFSLTLIGYGAYQKELEHYAYRDLGLSPDAVRFVTGLSGKDLIEWYCTSHIFLFSSITETQGLVLAEALSQGLPIIACDGPGIRDALMPGVNGLIVTNPCKMANGIKRMVASSDCYERFCQEAFRTSLSYRPERATQELVDFYYSVLSA